MRTLRIGSEGLEVFRVQQALNQRMLPPVNQLTKPPLKPLGDDGKFGPKTAAMVKEFQRLNGVVVDGIVGPVTWYLLFPFISVSVQLTGDGRIRGRGVEIGETAGAGRFAAASRPISGGSKAKDSVGDDKPTDAKDEEVSVEANVGTGSKHQFTPWFVLKPNEEPQGGESEAAISIEATVPRRRGFEVGPGLEFTRQLSALGGATWHWEGAIKGAYKTSALDFGPLSLSPVASLGVKQGLILSAGVGVEATLKFSKGPDAPELTVGGQVASEWDPHGGTIQVGPEISAGLKVKWDLTRFVKK